ncbi:MAG: hypothetical protein GXP25_17970 [Planctomycetes bacterium]|nr:hypothetical protein [Planctomycetota bacterium]
MLRRFLLVLVVFGLVGVMIGCGQSARRDHNASVIASDFQLMQRDLDTALGLNRTGIYHRYDSPCMIHGH